ncbi:hypothetical protein [Candidatus Thiosymbion oneisti]|uniref:hypothetical protein n=1 Tax=Candidatus Thiosymbion oneisti TaxID=589554 RepID=UPI00105C2EB6|nr:hypothetical protein [Candidatus Thiosymbion oneisti]
MKPERLALLEDELRVLEKATEHLGYSIDRVQALKDKPQWTPEELERFESLASRFSRLADLHIQRVMRLIDDLELVPKGSLLDRIERAEKRGWIAAPDLVRIRELRNLIAHEYVEDRLHELHLAVLELTPLLIELTPKVAAFGRVLIARYGGLGAVS